LAFEEKIVQLGKLSKAGKACSTEAHFEDFGVLLKRQAIY